ncbi:MAG: hypothetical protein IIB08_01910 [Bacteroidetes bacterium]|nr:hypothetical protein [Bacteroidota bacterium]
MKGKTKADFEKWYLNKDDDITNSGIYDTEVIDDFNSLPDSMKWGVEVDYYGEYDIEMDVIVGNGKKGEFDYEVYEKNSLRYYRKDKDPTMNRYEARKAALEKACEIRNKQL